MFPTNPTKSQIYHVTFENYLQPKKPHKTRTLLFPNAPEVKTKNAWHTDTTETNATNLSKKNKWQKITKKLRDKLKNLNKIQTHDAAKLSDPNTQVKSRLFFNIKLPKLAFKLPNFLAFLRARNDDGLCKRKSGFEIYCEMSSIHGFYNFVGAKTWQRAFWFSVVFLAILLSTIVVIMSYLINYESPFIISTESTTHAAWTIPFPAITICSQNRISKIRAERIAKDWLPHTERNITEIVNLFRYTLYSTDSQNINQTDLNELDRLLNLNNATLEKLFKNISPDCEAELLRCKWQGRLEKCEKLFRKVSTPIGICCSFNLMVHKKMNLRRTFSAGYKTGLTVLLTSNKSDYMASVSKEHGYRVLVHDAINFPGIGSEHHLVRKRTEASLTITPQSTYSTEYVSTETFKRRRCYLENELKLETFTSYSFDNCLAECRSKIFYNLCGCVPMFMPTTAEWMVCNASQIPCIVKNSEIFTKMLVGNETRHAYRTNRYAEGFICDCYPPCDFNQYSAILDMGTLDRTYSLSTDQFFKGIQFNDHIVLHIFYGDLVAHKLRMDVKENWLSFIGSFGGITGLFMGCSFVSVCEMIFFVFVRPACNWLTKQQIRYRIKRRQKKAAKLEKEKQKLAAELNAASTTETNIPTINTK